MHELKNSLNPLVGGLEIISAIPIGIKYSEIIDTTILSVRILQNIVKNMELSVNVDNLKINKRETELSEKIMNICKIFKPIREINGISLNLELDENLQGALNIDGEKIEEVIMNLIYSSVRNIGRGGIHVRVEWHLFLEIDITLQEVSDALQGALKYSFTDGLMDLCDEYPLDDFSIQNTMGQYVFCTAHNNPHISLHKSISFLNSAVKNKFRDSSIAQLHHSSVYYIYIYIF